MESWLTDCTRAGDARDLLLPVRLSSHSRALSLPPSTYISSFLLTSNVTQLAIRNTVRPHIPLFAP